MANPAFSKKAFDRVLSIPDTSKMTLEGTIHKTGILIFLALLGGVAGWTLQNPLLLMAGLLGGFILSLVIIFKPQTSAYLSQPYALLEGVILGSISVLYSRVYPGIVDNALILTCTVFILMLGLYYYKIIRMSDKLRTTILLATASISLVYFIGLIMGLFGHSIPMIHESGTVGIIFSVLVVGVAAFNLLIDFDMIEKAEASEAPQFMEWYGAFALLLTIVWLYIEILNLLRKMNKR